MMLRAVRFSKHQIRSDAVIAVVICAIKSLMLRRNAVGKRSNRRKDHRVVMFRPNLVKACVWCGAGCYEGPTFAVIDEVGRGVQSSALDGPNGNIHVQI